MATPFRQPGRKWDGTDPDTVLSLARYLGKCKSTPDLTCTAASLLSKTLTARATRLESSASRVRVAAEKERYRRTSAAKRRRASGPNNMSQFMRETIRNRKSQGKVRVTVTQQDRLETVAAHPSDDGDLFQKCSNNNSTSSRLIASFVVPPRANKVYSDDGRSRYCSTPVLTKRDRPNNLNRAWSAGVVGRGSPHSCTSSPEGPSKDNLAQRRLNLMNPGREECEKSWSLENDTDIRILLERARYPDTTASKNRPATAGHHADATASGGDRSTSRRRPASSRGLIGRSQTTRTSGATQDVRPTVSAACKGGAILSPQTRIDSLRRGRPFLQHAMRGGGRRARSDVVQIRREMLIHSHGQGRNVHSFAQDQFEATAMGRRATCGRGPIMDRSERVRWLPAKTLDGLDRLERSRMLMNKRPVVTSLHVWT